MKKNNKAFSIIEILIWSLVFTIGILAAYSMVVGILKMNDYNKNYIIASLLAKEQVELVRNIRDSNYSKIQVYNKINPNSTTYWVEDKFQTWAIYKIQNDLSWVSTFPVTLDKIDISSEPIDLTDLEQFRLCIKDNLYVYCDSSDDWKTNFYKYIVVSEIKYKDDDSIDKVIDNWFKLKSKVVWYSGKRSEYEINTIFTDFKIF